MPDNPLENPSPYPLPQCGAGKQRPLFQRAPYPSNATQQRHFAVLLALGACLWALPDGRIAAAEEMEDALARETAEAKAEDEADRARGEGYSSEKTYSGRLVLGQVEEGRTDIVGLFTMENGKTYPVKLAYDGQLAELQEYNRKTINLQGKFRNQGKYFVVTGIIHPPAPTMPITKLGGL